MLKGLKIRSKVTIYLTVISLFGFLFVFADKNLRSTEYQMENYRDDIQNIQTLIYKSLQLQNEFLLTESRTNTFHETGECQSLDAFDQNIKELLNWTTVIQKKKLTHHFNLSEAVLKLLDLTAAHKENLNKLKVRTLEKGYFDYGKEGAFRKVIHDLEDNYKHLIPLSDILQLRRSEKDFMLRHDKKYLYKNTALIKKMVGELDTFTSESRIAISLLNYYSKTFQAYVKLDDLIGFNNENGIRKDINQNTNQLLNQLALIVNNCETKILLYSNFYTNIFTGFVILFILLLAILIFYSAKNLSKPISELSEGINRFIKEDYKQKMVFKSTDRQDEIGDLIRNFNTLQIEIADHFKNYRINAAQKESELKIQSEKIRIQSELVKASKSALENELSRYSSSLKYASRIQRSILPDPEKINRIFGEIGLFYSPKDVVSGDFYWAHENKKFKYAAVVDCTGHGVPGALMSMLGISCLNSGIKDQKIEDTDKLLDYLNNSVTEVLGQYGSKSKVKDGMDISLIRIDKQNNMLQFSGAQREIVIVRNQEINRLKPDRYPIGWILPGAKKQFSSQLFELQHEDLVVMYTDGVTDQFGGSKFKKFMRQQLYDQLQSVEKLAVTDIAKSIQINVESWKGIKDQTDDICLMALKYQAVKNSIMKPEEKLGSNLVLT